MKTFLGYTWMSPKTLTNEVKHSSALIQSIMTLLSQGMHSKEKLQQIETELKRLLENIDLSLKKMSTNFWKTTYISIFRDLQEIFDEWEILFNAGRLHWIAERIILGNYLSDPNLVSTSVGMLEAIYPDVNPVTTAKVMNHMRTSALLVIQQNVMSSTLAIQDQLSKPMGYRDLNDLTAETLKNMEKMIDAHKSKS